MNRFFVDQTVGVLVIAVCICIFECELDGHNFNVALNRKFRKMSSKRTCIVMKWIYSNWMVVMAAETLPFSLPPFSSFYSLFLSFYLCVPSCSLSPPLFTSLFAFSSLSTSLSSSFPSAILYRPFTVATTLCFRAL